MTWTMREDLWHEEMDTGFNRKIGYHASGEQFRPSELLDLVRAAEAAGFGAAMCSDHFSPWSRRQGESAFAWSWLGAALQATTLSFGVVNAPGQRYHPAIVAQAAATLYEMFPDRFWIALGSGELINERITGDRWPTKTERDQRLLECADVIRRLLSGETVTHNGLIRVEEAKIYTLPSCRLPIFGAAITPKTAEWMGGWADGLITVSGTREKMQEVVDAFRRGGGAGKPMYLQAKVSYAKDDDQAMKGAWDQWRSNIFESHILSDLRTCDQLDSIAEFVRPDDLRSHVRISSDLEEHTRSLKGDLEMGFKAVYIHNVNRGQKAFIRDFGDHVIPALMD